MHLGLCLPQLGPHCDGGRVGSFARSAEDLGYHSLWVGDRLLTPEKPVDLYPGGGTDERPYPPEFTAALDPLVVLTAAAVSTTSVRLGSGTLNATWHNPVLLGRSLTSLDAVSGGRLDAGFGMGWSRDEYTAVGVPWAERGARLEETLDVLAALWTDNPVEHHGQHFDMVRSVVDLRPVQIGGPPVLLGGYGKVALERVGRRAAGWLPVWGLPTEYLDSLWQIARAAAETAGRDPDTLRREMRVNAVPGQTVDELAAICGQIDRLGIDGAYIDLTFSTGSVDESLDVAGALIGRLA